MSRLYFTCPIKALYMMKEFGVKFKCYSGISFNEYDLIGQLKGMRSGEFYVSEESEKIFTPKEDDHGYHKKEGYHYFDTYFGAWLPDSRSKCVKSHKFKDIQIVMRDNKQFFNPEVENES